MRERWLKLIELVLRPARPDLERCLGQRERHLAARRLVAEERALAIAGCERRIEDARAAVFAANDGVVPALMTDLEREWRRLSRTDPDAGLMDLWAALVPDSWVDRKRWRDSHPARRLDVLIALAADVPGVEAAESAIDALRAALGSTAMPIGSRIRWQASGDDSDSALDSIRALLAGPLREATEALAARGLESVVQDRAGELERNVHEAACARFPEHALLARALAHAAFVDCTVSASRHANPVALLCDLWKTGYVLSAFDSSGVVLALPLL